MMVDVGEGLGKLRVGGFEDVCILVYVCMYTRVLLLVLQHDLLY